MTVKGRMPRKPKRCAARTHHMSVTQPIMAMGMAMPGMMPAVRDSFRMMTVNGTPTTNDHANMRSVSCSCQVGSSRQPSPVCARTGTQVGAADLRFSFPCGNRPQEGVCSAGLAALSDEQRSQNRLVSRTRIWTRKCTAMFVCTPTPSQVLAWLCSCKHDVAATKLSDESKCAAATAQTTTAAKVAILCHALCTLSTPILQGNSTREHKGTH